MITILFILLTVLLHELGHVFAALSLGLNVKRWGANLHGVYIVREAGDPLRNAMVMLAGPAMNLLLAALFGRTTFGIMNLVFALVNLVPMSNTDGRHLLSLLQKQAQRQTADTKAR